MTPGNRALLFPLGIIATILVGWLLRVGSDILQPLVIALLLASLLSPVVRLLERIRIPPLVSVLGVVTLVFFGLFQLAVVAQENVAAFLRDTSTEAPRAPAGNGTQTSAIPPLGGGAPDEGAQPSHGDPDDAVPPAEDPEDDESSPAPQGDESVGDDDSDPDAAGPDPGAEQDASGDPDDGADADQGESTTDSDEDDAGLGLLGGLQEAQTEAIQQAGGLGAILDKLNERLQRSALPAPVIDYLSNELMDLKTDGRMGRWGQQFLGGGLEFTRTLILVLIYVLFIFAEQAVFRRKILAVAGDRRDDAARILDTIGRGIQQFLGIKTLISVATGALCYTVLVVLGIPYALLFGFLTFLLNYIPYFGSLLAGILPTVTALAIEPTFDKAIIVAITYLLVNLFLGSFVEPKILGRELDLSPLVIIVSVVIWGSLWGVPGAFLAVPLTATLQIVLASSETTRPIAVLLSSGPPRDSRRGLRRFTGQTAS